MWEFRAGKKKDSSGEKRRQQTKGPASQKSGLGLQNFCGLKAKNESGLPQPSN